MKLNELISEFRIALSNEEAALLEAMDGVKSIHHYNEREQFIIGNLIRKSLVSKVMHQGTVMVVKNELKSS